MKSKAWSSPRRGNNPVSLFSGYLQFYCLTNARSSQPSWWEPSQAEEPGARLRITSEPPDGICQSALPTAMEMPWRLSLGPLQGVSCQSRSASSASLAAHLHSGGLRCQMPCHSAIRTHGRAAGRRRGTGHQPVALGIVGLDLRPRQGFDSQKGYCIFLCQLLLPPLFPSSVCLRVQAEGWTMACWPGEAGRASSHGFYCQYNFAQEFFEVRFSTLIS